jgi:hypothetical protein
LGKEDSKCAKAPGPSAGARTTHVRDAFELEAVIAAPNDAAQLLLPAQSENEKLPHLESRARYLARSQEHGKWRVQGEGLRDLNVTPHIAQNTTNRTSAIDA